MSIGFFQQNSLNDQAQGDKLIPMVDRTLTQRFELKYHISEIHSEAIQQYISSYLPLDYYSQRTPSGFYPIVSLYADTSDFQLCKETLESKKNRFKLRIRAYNDNPKYPLFLEIKRRINRVIHKSRCRIYREHLLPVLQGHHIYPHPTGTDMQVLNQFQFYYQHLKANPTMLIRYDRKAYQSDQYNRVRVTFDRNLLYQTTEQATVFMQGNHWQRNRYTNQGVILEIKFTGNYPIWLSRMCATFGLESCGISKYCSSVQQSCELGHCAPRRGYAYDE